MESGDQVTGEAPVLLGRARRLSPMQRSLLASHLAHPDHPAQSMPLLSHLDGPIDADRLARAFAEVVATNDVLRTRLGGPGAASVDALDLADAADLPATDVVALDRSEVDDWARARAATPLDLSRCCWDSAIASHPDGTATWYLNLNHVITDATSSALVFTRTAEVYHGAEAAPAASYYDWARRLGETIEAGDGPSGRATAHWRNRSAAPRLGRLYRAPDRTTPIAHRLPLDLGPVLDRARDRIGGDYRMLTDELAWSTLLVTAAALWSHRLTGADRFAIGLPVHNRSDPECRDLIGPTMEVFPVDIEVEDGDTGRSLHKRVGRSIMRTLGQAVPGTAPSAEVEVVVNVIPRADQSRFGDLPASTRWVHTGAIDGSHLARIQMTAYDGPTESNGSNGSDRSNEWDFALDLNEGAAEAEHRAVAPGHLVAVLTQLVDEPDAPIGARPLTTPDEVAVLDRWGDEPALDDPAPDLVDAIRRSLAGATGTVVVDGETELSGPELLAWAEALSGRLVAQGIGPGSRVAVDLPRSAEGVVVILATLLAGSSFVPLDPSQPLPRRQRLIERADCALVIDRLELVTATRPGGDGPPDPSPRTVASDQAREAYVIFTSGSTGEPKGVPITVDGLSRYLRFAAARYTGDGRPPVVAPLFSPLTFDLTITSLFLPLLTGGRLLVIPEDGPRGLARVAEHTDITWLKATPSHLEILTRLLPAEHELAVLVVGGEAFGTRLAGDLLAARPALEIHNEYGPTEAVVGCMDYRVEPELLDRQTEVPIGRPAPGVTLAVVDRYGHRVPPGAPGELWIAHPGLTAGYLTGTDAGGAATETASEVATDSGVDGPFVEHEGRRWYRSGDLVRLQDPDRLVYLGRIDEQVKVGGIRLEPMEVEEALAAHPAIDRAAVRLWSPAADAPGAHCLRCGLPDNIPGVGFDDAGICDTCHAYDRVAPMAESWFRTGEDLARVRDRARERRTGDHDCLHLLSGGKDSTYALYQLVEAGFRPYALTLDNGFISEEAKANVARSVEDLGIDHEFVTLEAMNAIFRDSLERHSNVCHGCYKAIYTVATNRADELGIPLIVTGLSRGQLFETRLIPQQFSADRFDPDAIDRAVLEARKVYHRLDDGPNRLLDTEIFTVDETFERIEYLDFYRYVDVELSEMLRFLDQRAPWVRPSDTGRSTNCLINAAGIHTHQTEQGFHNYAVPYAWDVRLGHKTRQEAIDELDDRLDLAEVEAMLGEVGYEPRQRRILTAWVVPASTTGDSDNGTADRPADRPAGSDGFDAAAGPGAIPSPAELRAFLARTLPSHAIPSAFVAVDTLPLSTNGKLDAGALPRPERVHRPGPTLALSATTPIEEAVIEVWERVLATEPIGIDDDFFALGGDSLAALEMIVALGERLGRTIGEDLAFTNATPRALAAAVDAAGSPGSDGDGTQATDGAADPVDRSELGDGATGIAGPGGGDPTDHRTADGATPERSPGELAVLYDQSQRPNDVMYNVARVFRITGPFDGPAFARALRAEVDAHQPLTWTHGSPRRRLAPDEAVSIDLHDESISAERFQDLADRLNRRPVDLENGPLLRAATHPLDDGTTGVVLAIHHASGDAASFDRLMARIDTRLRDETPDAPPVDYAGFAAWQEAAHTPDDVEHWLAQARRGAPAALAVHPPTRPEPDGFSTRVASVDATALRDGARTSPAAAALAALAAAIGAHSDTVTPADPVAGADGAASNDVEIGLITSTRNHPAADDLFGYFLNTLPVRIGDAGPGGEASLRRLADSAASAIGGALAHRTYPRSRILADRRAAGLPASDLSVLMAWDDLDELRLGSATVDQRVLWNGTAVAPLTFFAESRADRLDLSVEWKGDTIPAEVAEGLLGLWDDLLTAMATAADTSTADAVTRSLADADRLALVDGPAPADAQPILARIERHLTAGTDAPAVICGGRSLTWAELDARSGAVARLLSGRHLGRGDRVAVAIPRSVETLVAIVGVLRAGAAYVPLDPGYPADRIALVLDRSDAAAILVAPETDRDPGDPGDPVGSAPAPAGRASIVVGPTTLDGAPWPDDDTADDTPLPASTVEAADEAYLIFTSGSTGRPRGVAVSHGHLTASTAARQGVYPEAPRRFLVPSSPAFDSSIVGLFWTLAEAGTVVLPTEREVHDVEALLGLMADVDHTLLVPTLYQALLTRRAAMSTAEGPWPRRVIVAGESCPPSLVAAHHEWAPGSALTNEYGPTEATVWATAHHCRLDDDPVPIGPPIPGARVAVLGPDDRIRPTGVEGELVIGGAGVVDGYLDEPEATAAAFGRLPAPGDGPMFRTGDRAVIAGGTVHFLGRDDDRLNLGGVRAEPEEIERVLTAVDGVTAAIAVAADVRSRDDLLTDLAPAEVARAFTRAADRDDPAGALLGELRREARPDVRLVAHLEAPADLDRALVREAARDGLPAGLRPSHIVVHDRLPRTPNGKLDRAAATELPVDDRPAGAAATNTAPVDDELTATLTARFAEALRQPGLGPGDSFFDNGGHSLLAMELALAIEDELGTRVPVADLYDHPTPVELARHLGGAVRTARGERSFLVSIQPAGRRTPIFAIHVLGIDCAFFRPLSARLGPDQPVYGLGQPTAELDTAGPTDVGEVASSYADEIDVVAPDGPVVLAAISLGGVVAYEVAQQLRARGRDVELLALFDAFGPDALAPTGKQWLNAQLSRASADPARYLREQADHQRARMARTAERAGLALRRRLGVAIDDKLEIRRFIEENVQAQVAYRYEPYDGQMLVVKAGDDPLAADHVADGMGWRSLATGGLELAIAPGAHLSMMQEPNVEAVADAMRRTLTALTGRATGPAELVTAEDADAAVIEALAERRLPSAITRLQRRAEPGSEADRSLARVDDVLTTLSRAADRSAGAAATTLAAAGVAARALPVPTRLAYPIGTVELVAPAPGDAEAANRALLAAGFLAVDATGSGFRAGTDPGRTTAQYLAPDGTSRVQVRASGDPGDAPVGGTADEARPGATVDQARPGPTDNEARPGPTDNEARPGPTADLGILLGTPPGLIEPLLDVAGLGPGQRLVDLGCGDARVLIEAARSRGVLGRGHELDPEVADLARRRVEEAGVAHLVEIVTGDARSADLADADLVFAFLPPDAVAEILEPVLDRLSPGSWLLGHEQLDVVTDRRPDRRHVVAAPGDGDRLGGITVANLWAATAPDDPVVPVDDADGATA